MKPYKTDFFCARLSQNTQRKLLAEIDLTFVKAVEWNGMPQAMEMAEKNAGEIKPVAVTSAASSNMHKIARSKPQQANAQGFANQRSTGASASKPQESRRCFRCLGNHNPNKCHFKNAKCYECNQYGHIGKACALRKGEERQPKSAGAKYVAETDDQDMGIFSVHHSKIWAKPDTQDEWMVKLSIDGHDIQMEIDTGAKRFVMSYDMYRKYFSHIQLRVTPDLKTYTQEDIPIAGEIDVPVSYGSQSVTLSLVIAKGPWPTLMGRDWLRRIHLDWPEIIRSAPCWSSQFEGTK